MNSWNFDNIWCTASALVTSAPSQAEAQRVTSDATQHSIHVGQTVSAHLSVYHLSICLPASLPLSVSQTRSYDGALAVLELAM